MKPAALFALLLAVGLVALSALAAALGGLNALVAP